MEAWGTTELFDSLGPHSWQPQVKWWGCTCLFHESIWRDVNRWFCRASCRLLNEDYLYKRVMKMWGGWIMVRVWMGPDFLCGSYKQRLVFLSAVVLSLKELVVCFILFQFTTIHILYSPNNPINELCHSWDIYDFDSLGQLVTQKTPTHAWAKFDPNSKFSARAELGSSQVDSLRLIPEYRFFCLFFFQRLHKL